MFYGFSGVNLYLQYLQDETKPVKLDAMQTAARDFLAENKSSFDAVVKILSQE
jgi:hypothetical protein